MRRRYGALNGIGGNGDGSDGTAAVLGAVALIDLFGPTDAQTFFPLIQDPGTPPSPLSPPSSPSLSHGHPPIPSRDPPCAPSPGASARPVLQPRLHIAALPAASSAHDLPSVNPLVHPPGVATSPVPCLCESSTAIRRPTSVTTPSRLAMRTTRASHSLSPLSPHPPLATLAPRTASNASGAGRMNERVASVRGLTLLNAGHRSRPVPIWASLLP
ncbi:hypothetical protein BD413DRAFT_571171 [Trametes elegans]|nr:hypothetical protein BD413DRAFT_571171 [Trametes elegans]